MSKKYFDIEPYRDVEAQLRTWDVENIKEYAGRIPEHGIYLEIGTKYGGSAYLVRCNALESVEVWSVDYQPQLYMFKGHENEVDINWVKETSAEAVKNWVRKIDLLFIDGDHGEFEPNAPWEDFEAWEKFVPKGGIIIFHDYHPDYPSVVRAGNDAMKTGRFEILFQPPELASRQDTDMFIIKKIE